MALASSPNTAHPAHQRLDAAQIRQQLVPGAPNFPELEQARVDISRLRQQPQVQAVLAASAPCLEGVAQIPLTGYTSYRLFRRTGDRREFETPYFLKRARLSSLALRMFLGQTDLKDMTQDYLINICEESNWVLPAHENLAIDLFAAETAFSLAETLHLLGAGLDAEIHSRVRAEIERRVFNTYLQFHQMLWWYDGSNNWNGVCNSSVAAAFLVLERDPARLAQALEIALRGLGIFLETAFESDGSSTEGVGYWQYGLIHYAALAEMLRARTDGAIDLLANDRMRAIAAYPSSLHLSGSSFAPFSDGHEETLFEPGFLSRLSSRTGLASLGTLARPTSNSREVQDSLPILLRNIFWWDGTYSHPTAPADAFLPDSGIARLVSPTGKLVTIIKAGHNAENHNHNDVGSFVVHAVPLQDGAVGETFLTDPGAGLYTRQYFSDLRYNNLFANSYGHSVPRVGGQLQQTGKNFAGKVLRFETSPGQKLVEMEIAQAYPWVVTETLLSARRTLALNGSELTLTDAYQFDGEPLDVEEAFLTWLDVEIQGAVATIKGQHRQIQMTIEMPVHTNWALEHLDEASRQNHKTTVLKRLHFTFPAQISGKQSNKLVAIVK